MGPTGHAYPDSAEVTVLRGYSRCLITTQTSQIEGTQFGQELATRREAAKEYPFGRCPPEFSPLHLIYQHCLPTLERLVPDTSIHDLTLEAFLHQPTYHLTLVRAPGTEDILIEGETTITHAPAFFISPLPASDLPSQCHSLLIYPANTITLSPSTDPSTPLQEIQGAVTTRGGEKMYFKPRVEAREAEFLRELRILSKLNTLNLDSSIRVPKLLGLITSNSTSSIIGILLTLIPGVPLSSPTLHSPTNSSLHTKWLSQLRHIVTQLHANGIVWGDVHPMNIMIDEAMDAWAIDFGGMNNVEFIDDGVRETVEGDWMGVGRVGEWLGRKAGEANGVV
ncbi:hypothetical protein BKA63DRAFT_496432 [Paraphoma chrysanthemicola]|nr:hypothetical protein BKA63DRAFT_496432 [Paraphoma chrysanthemicola]